jgi:hypothetical protein
MRDRNTPSPDQLREQLEKLRRDLPPEQYAQASTRIIRALEKQKPRRYAIT